MRRTLQTLLGALACAVPMFFSGQAQAAGLDSCGNIYVSAEAECTVYADIDCEAMCTPVNVTAACAADLRVACTGECNVSASAECTGSCSADCEAECDIKPAEFNCHGSCQADCSADCEGRCAADGSGAECAASCKATCSGSCDASCKVTPAEADCQAKCDASCSGSCKAEANADCQIDCQASGFADCKVDVEGGCKGRCSEPEGALFCDGQYVDAGNNLEECIAALKAIFAVEVYADGSAMCSGNTCTAEGVAGCSCTSSDSGDLPLALLGLGVVAFGVTRRRRQA
ncbi:MAG: MYXO-CTERM sorting domain-containing protein [Nannocystis sp.]|nr:MYXO-CTERM sorting domain-containing protein [Nannocystis sp.]MBA3548570.1 MYXO-CTERM sorting domain-containing protein [Nannocystis sp.]